MLIALAGVLTPSAALADAGAQTQLRPLSLAQWFPMRDWRPLLTSSGDFDRDGRIDVAVILERTAPPVGPDDPPRTGRVLVILNSDGAGAWRRGPELDDLLPCGRCGDAISGVVESLVFDLKLTADGVLEVGWVRWREDLAGVWLRIGWDSRARGPVLLGDRITTAGRHVGDQTRLVRDYQAGIEHRDGREQTIPVGPIPLADVVASDY